MSLFIQMISVVNELELKFSYFLKNKFKKLFTWKKEYAFKLKLLCRVIFEVIL